MANASTTYSSPTLTTANMQRYDVAYLADDTDGSLDPVTVSVRTGLLVHWEHNPGGTVATSGFGVTLTNDNDVDAMCGGGAGIVTTAGANDTGGPTPGGGSVSPVPVSGDLDFASTGNSVNSAVGVFSFYIITL